MATCSDHTATQWQHQDENLERLPGKPSNKPYLGWGLLSGSLCVLGASGNPSRRKKSENSSCSQTFLTG